MLDPGRGRTKLGQLWAYARDDRPWGGPEPQGVAFVYAGDRAASSPALHLAGYRGVLQTDGYGAYKALAKAGAVELAFCWTHTRRYFHKLLDEKTPAKTPIAAETIARIGQLYAVEAGIRGLSPDERRAVRQEKSAPILADLQPWLSARLELISQKSDLAKAIRYVLTHWDGLTRFLGDGRIELDTNTVERAIRPLALTRKNSLFAGSEGGAQHWAVLARSSPPAGSTTSSPRPTSKTSSPSWWAAISRAVSTSFFPGPTPPDPWPRQPELPLRRAPAVWSRRR